MGLAGACRARPVPDLPGYRRLHPLRSSKSRAFVARQASRSTKCELRYANPLYRALHAHALRPVLQKLSGKKPLANSELIQKITKFLALIVGILTLGTR